MAILAIAGIALASSGGDDDGTGPGERAAKPAGEQAASEQQPTATSEPVPAEEPPAPDGAALNDQGFALIQEGDYEAAIPILEQAVEQLRGSGDELTYNYALFNLGQALRLAGRPEEAIPILQERLAFPNQRGQVARELQAALSDAGFDGGDEGKDGNKGKPEKPGKAKGHEDDD